MHSGGCLTCSATRLKGRQDKSRKRPPSRETGGADQEWEELDRLEVKLMECKVRLGEAEAAATPAARRSAAGSCQRLSPVWPGARQYLWTWLVGNPGRRPGSGSLF